MEATPRIETKTYAELDELTQEWSHVANIDGIDSVTEVWVDEAIYRVFTKTRGLPTTYAALISFDSTVDQDWSVIFRQAMLFATNLVVAGTKAAMG
jgi:hypothetical protein